MLLCCFVEKRSRQQKDKVRKGREENEKSRKVSDKQGWEHGEEQRKQRHKRGGKVWREERGEIRAEKDAVRSQGQLQGQLSE